MFTADIPSEPAEFSVLLDRDCIAWQHRDGLWHPAQSGTHANCRCTSGHIASGHRLRPTGWNQLLIERGPLAALITEGEAVEYADSAVKQALKGRA